MNLMMRRTQMRLLYTHFHGARKVSLSVTVQLYCLLHELIVLFWCLAELVQFLGKLDERYEAKLKKDNVLMARKVRHLGEESCRCQPPNSPKWTVKQPAAGQCCNLKN